MAKRRVFTEIPTEITIGGVTHVLISPLAEIPTEITIGGVTYALISPLQEWERRISGYKFAKRSAALQACRSEQDGQNLLDNQQDIPVALRGRVMFVFTDWRSKLKEVAFVSWDDHHWVQWWYYLGLPFLRRNRVLCRKSA